MNTWHAQNPHSDEVVSFKSSDFDPYELEDKLGLPIVVTDADGPVATILPEDDLEAAQRLRVVWSEQHVEATVKAAQRLPARCVRIVRGEAGGKPWGYDITDSHLKARIEHVGSLVEAETFARGYALGLFNADETEVEIRIGPEGMSTRKALLEP